MCTHALLLTIVLLRIHREGQVIKSKNPHPPLGERDSPKQEDENTKKP